MLFKWTLQWSTWMLWPQEQMHGRQTMLCKYKHGTKKPDNPEWTLSLKPQASAVELHHCGKVWWTSPCPLRPTPAGFCCCWMVSFNAPYQPSFMLFMLMVARGQSQEGRHQITQDNPAESGFLQQIKGTLCVDLSTSLHLSVCCTHHATSLVYVLINFLGIWITVGFFHFTTE